MLTLLNGVRVLDFSRLIPGGYATAKLADLGADVVKVEELPAGDYMRSVPPMYDGASLLYLALNRNKRSVALDFKTDAGRDAFEQLVRASDVFIESSRPGAMKRLGADYDSLRSLQPDLIYCSLSGFGQNGPYAHLPSHGANLEAAAGFVQIEQEEDGTARAPNIRVFMASQAGAMHAALAIVAALEKRHRTGEGSYLDVSCWDGAVSWQYGNLTCLANIGTLFPGSEGLGPRYGCYQTADGRWLFFGAIEPKFWMRFCDAIHRPDLRGRIDAGAAMDYGENDPGLGAEMVSAIGSRTQAEWVALAVQHQLPVAPVLRPDELLENDHVAARGVFVETPHPSTGDPMRLMSLPLKVEGEVFEVERPAPALGEHTEQVLVEWTS